MLTGLLLGQSLYQSEYISTINRDDRFDGHIYSLEKTIIDRQTEQKGEVKKMAEKKFNKETISNYIKTDINGNSVYLKTEDNAYIVNENGEIQKCYEYFDNFGKILIKPKEELNEKDIYISDEEDKIYYVEKIEGNSCYIINLDTFDKETKAKVKNGDVTFKVVYNPIQDEIKDNSDVDILKLLSTNRKNAEKINTFISLENRHKQDKMISLQEKSIRQNNELTSILSDVLKGFAENIKKK